MKKIFLCMVLCLTLFKTYGQNKKVVDSLERLLVRSDDASRKIDILFNLSCEFYDIDNVIALRFADEALSLVDGSYDSVQFVRTCRIKGQLLRRLDRLDESADILRKIEPIAFRNQVRDEYKKILNGLAIVYTFKADYNDALKYNFKSLLIREKDGNKIEIAVSHNNIALVYFKIGNFSKAAEYFTKALSLQKEIGNSYDVDRMLINLGLCYNQLDRFLEGRKCIYEALKLCDKNCSQPIKMEAHFGLGVSFYEESFFSKAREEFLTSYEFAKAQNDKRFQTENLIFLGRLDIDQSCNDEAAKKLTEAELLATTSRERQLMSDIYFEFSRLYNKRSDFKNAAAYQDKYIGLNDSIYGRQRLQDILVTQTEFEQYKNLDKIEAQDKIIKLNEALISQQRWLNIAAALALFSSASFILMLYLRNRQKRKINENLEQKVRERTIELESSFGSLRRVNADQSYFISKASEEIKIPLMTLQGICSLASKEHPSAQEYIDKVDAIAQQLMKIINNRLSMVVPNQS